MARERKSVHVSKALEGVMQSLESGKQLRESLALAYWDEAAGEHNAASSEADAVRDGILFVRTRSSTWSQELTFFKQELIERLNRMVGAPVIRDIRFRATGLKRKKGQPEEPPGAPADLDAVALSPHEQAALEAELARLCEIEAEEIRLAVARRITRDRKLRRWRLDNGWKACSKCGAPHEEAGLVCPICRLCC